MKKGVHLIISGMVQGVGFRYYVHHCARRHFLKGWVKNLVDGRVETVAEGDEEELREFVKEIKKGSRFSHVDDVQIEWLSFSNKFHAFEITD
ncbi:MAG: acylphosphatase [candidate division KSB1 bacterium]|nr:acylphosphatase [candidate division KSB1 bacterium]MDZ7301602.1 acylphosphatase [candidate division KSB1 bacterium]MDZ7310982.1 acylphosphatase [candidate division KSB1 bacterium]